MLTDAQVDQLRPNSAARSMRRGGKRGGDSFSGQLEDSSTVWASVYAVEMVTLDYGNLISGSGRGRMLATC